MSLANLMTGKQPPIRIRGEIKAKCSSCDKKVPVTSRKKFLTLRLIAVCAYCGNEVDLDENT